MKIKPLTKEQILISLDRLTRFKETETKYMRVFTEVILSNLVSPRIKKTEIEKMNKSEIRDLATEIFNCSFSHLGLEIFDDYVINQRLLDYESAIYDLNIDVVELLKNKINYRAALPLIVQEAPKNLLWLKELASAKDLIKTRREKGLRFPLEEIVLVEGVTEEILLPEFARVCGYDFDKNGIYVISAGGKNQVVKYFYKLVQNCKLPIFVLLDSDAIANLDELRPRLRDIDRIHILKCGEFEDALPETLVRRTLDYATKNISLSPEEEITQTSSRVEYLQEYFRHRGLHEFKKADFAAQVKANIKGKEDVSPEINEVIQELSSQKARAFSH